MIVAREPAGRWILADPARWERVGRAQVPSAVLSRPTVYSAHPLLVIDPAADRLLEALMSPQLQELAWTRHGFRGPLGTVTGATNASIAGMLPAEIDAVLPMPAADVMLSLLGGLEG